MLRLLSQAVSSTNTSTSSAQNVTVEASVSVFRARMTLSANTNTLRRISPNACSANATAEATAAAEAAAGNFTIPTYQTGTLSAVAEFQHPDSAGTLLADVSCCVPMSASGGSGSGTTASSSPAAVLTFESGTITAIGAVDNATVSIDPAAGVVSHRILYVQFCASAHCFRQYLVPDLMWLVCISLLL